MKKINNLYDNKIKAISMLINAYFWKNKIGPIFSILFPILFMIIYFILASDRNNISLFSNGLPAYMILSVLPLTTMTAPSMMIDFKNSIIFRKIKTSNITALKYSSLNFIWFFIYSFLFVGITLAIFAMFMSKDTSSLDGINWGSLIFAIILLIISSYAFGIFLTIFIKNSIISQLLGFGSIFIVMLFTGQFMPLYVIAEIKPFAYITLLFPINYAANLINIACVTANSNDIFNLSTPFIINHNGNNIEIYAVWQKALSLIGPIIWFFLLGFISVWKFKWISR